VSSAYDLPKGIHILIADASAVVRRILSRELERSGAVISLVDDGEKALNRTTTGEFDLVIADMDLPGIGGFELCRRLKAYQRTQQIPVVIMDSQESEDAVKRGYHAGATACISKIQPKDTLLDDIANVLKKATFQKGRLILVVDDSLTVRSLVSKSLKGAGFSIIQAENGRVAMEIMRHEKPDLILSDIDMPEMSGEAFCQAVHADPVFASIPFVVMSANNQRPIMRRMLQLGADSYLVKPFNVEQLVITVEKLLSDQLLLLHKEKERLEIEQRLILASITSLCNALEARDSYTRGHSEAVSDIASRIALQMGIPREEVELIRLGGKLHDLGKIGVIDSVLLKPGKLSDEEFAIIKRHPVIGGEILSPVPSMAPILPIVMYHHERIDGKGYPEGLTGSSIPLWARITAVGDTYHAPRATGPTARVCPGTRPSRLSSRRVEPSFVRTAWTPSWPWSFGTACLSARRRHLPTLTSIPPRRRRQGPAGMPVHPEKTCLHAGFISRNTLHSPDLLIMYPQGNPKTYCPAPPRRRRE
jgi:response regulator RpfG family c-di-GMP phosphodiesterase